MKLFVYTPYRNYTYGSTIVAAHDAKEADEILKRDRGACCTPVSFEREIEGVIAYGQPRIVENTTGEE